MYSNTDFYQKSVSAKSSTFLNFLLKHIRLEHIVLHYIKPKSQFSANLLKNYFHQMLFLLNKGYLPKKYYYFFLHMTVLLKQAYILHWNFVFKICLELKKKWWLKIIFRHAYKGQPMHCINKLYLYRPGFSVPSDVPKLDPGFYACVDTNCTGVRIFWKVIIFQSV